MGATGQSRFSEEALVCMVYKPRERPIPSVLTSSDEFRTLNEVQKQNFVSRLRYIEEICLKSHDWLKSRETFESIADFVDHIELDLFVNLAVGEESRSVSPWLVHSSWTFDSSPQSMLTFLPECLVEDSFQIHFRCDESEFLDWLKTRIDCMQLLLDTFYDADSFDCAIGCLIGIDVCISTLLTGVSKQRFNSRLMKK